MNFEDIGRVWREEPSGAIKRRRIEDLSDTLGRAESFLAPLHRRGTRVWVLTAVLCVPAFVLGVANAGRPELAVPGTLLVAVWLIVMGRRWRNMRPPPPDSTRPVREVVQAELERLRFLERFWGDVSWGWIAVFVVGEVLAFEGFRSIGAERTIITYLFYAILIGALTLVIFRNPVVARHKVRPLREDLESWLSGLEALEADHPTSIGPEGGHA